MIRNGAAYLRIKPGGTFIEALDSVWSKILTLEHISDTS